MICSMSDNVAVEYPDIEFLRPCNLCPRAQAVRATLLASATATTLKGRRARSCVSQGYFPGYRAKVVPARPVSKRLP
jgi:hypothetical protein